MEVIIMKTRYKIKKMICVKDNNLFNLQELIAEFYYEPGGLTFDYFKEAFFDDCEEEIKKYPQFYKEIQDKEIKSGYWYETLFKIYNKDLQLDLMADELISVIIKNFKNDYFYNFWLEIPKHYQKED
jgi:hypothetical protein